MIKLKLLGVALWLMTSFFFNERGVNAQSLPLTYYHNQNDYSFMWWEKTIKTGNKTFAIKTSHYSLSFNYAQLNLTDLVINRKQQPEDEVLRETNEESVPATGFGTAGLLSFGMEIDGTRLRHSGSGNIADCQLIETGKYFQRRFINKMSGFTDCDSVNTGLEISSWPDRLALVLRVIPVTDLKNRGLELEYKFPAAYNIVAKNGNVVVLKNPLDGSGFVVMQTTGATGMEVSGTTVRASRQETAICLAGKEISTGMIIYPVAADIDTRLAEIINQETHPVAIAAQQIAPLVRSLAVSYDRDMGWHRIALRNDPDTTRSAPNNNDRMERVRFSVANPSSVAKTVRLNFAKERNTGVFSITGLSAILRDADGDPVGIPVQVSKNWHDDKISGDLNRGPWYRGLLMLTIPANAEIELEYTGVNALWGGVPAASHAQLCLVGWGHNQQWDQAAIGSWGESITYEPDLDQAGAPVLDFRPLMIRSIKGGKWGWTGNMGGADFFNYTKTSGVRGWHSRMRTQYRRYSPNFTEVTYAGIMDDNSMDFEYTASVGRSDDITRGIYRIRLNVLKNTSFKDFVVFQAAAATYHYTKSDVLAWGNETGLAKQWKATIGGKSRYMTPKQEVKGRVPWFSFTDSRFAGGQDFKPANRGFVIRSWKARINGRNNAPPYFAEYNASGGHGESSGLINLTLPPDCTSLQEGDYIEAVIELFQIPLFADDYYGTNRNLAAALATDANTWKLVYREAKGNDLEVAVSSGSLISSYPVKIRVTEDDAAVFSVTGGHGYIPLTFTGLSGYKGFELFQKTNAGWERIDQSVYGNDFWQTDYNAVAGKWEITYNINLDSPGDARQTREFTFRRAGNRP